MLAGGATLLATVLPFATAGALDMMVRTGPARALDNAHQQGNPSSQVALSNLLDWSGLAAWDSRVEVLLAVLTLAATLLARRKGLAPMLVAAGIGYVVTVAANPYLHRYYYVAGVLLAGLGMAAIRAQVSPPDGGHIASAQLNRPGDDRPRPG